jgi:hypothetical protein
MPQQSRGAPPATRTGVLASPGNLRRTLAIVPGFATRHDIGGGTRPLVEAAALRAAKAPLATLRGQGAASCICEAWLRARPVSTWV